MAILAQDDARDIGDNYIGSEHILLGLLREDGLGAAVLNHFKIYYQPTKDLIMDHPTDPTNELAETIPWSPRGKKILEFALREALSLGHKYVGTEHILLGLVRDGGNELVQSIFEKAKVDATTVHNEVVRRLSGTKKPVMKLYVGPPGTSSSSFSGITASSVDFTNSKQDELIDKLEEGLTLIGHIARSPKRWNNGRDKVLQIVGDLVGFVPQGPLDKDN